VQEEYLKEQTKHKFSYVESKLTSTTVAIESKQTKKYNPETASSRDAITLAGNVLRTTGRAIPLWRQGV
jgi:predicted cobalt transporter CbtA